MSGKYHACRSGRKKIWLITGASRGLGRCLALAAAGAGHIVIATSRHKNTLCDLLDESSGTIVPLELELMDSNTILHAFREIEKKFGRIDVLVNNAGYLFFHPVETTECREVREAFETNFFGPLLILQKSLAMMRDNKSGHVFQISSAYTYGPGPGSGIYAAAKAALESMYSAAKLECAKADIKFTIVQPGLIKTDFVQSSLIRGQNSHPFYKDIEDRIADVPRRLQRAEGSDPDQIAQSILIASLADQPPHYLILGKDGIDHRKKCLERQDVECIHFH